MINFFKRKPAILVIITVFLLILLIYSTRKDEENLTVVGDAAGTVVTPVADATNGFFGGISNFFANLFGISNAQKENALLKEQLLQTESDVALNGELQKEIERLNEIAKYVRDNQQYDMITVRVVAKNPGYWFDTITINAGRNHDLAAGMVVLTPKGLVGRIIEVGHNWSKVLTIIDANCAVPGIIERTRDNGIIRGTIEVGETTGGLCEMHYLLLDNDLVPTDKVLTSGLGGVYPKGIMIGEITEVSREQGENVERTATIKPAADFAHIEEVMVIKQVIEAVSP